MQPKLLRVLQDLEFERLGGTQTLKVNFRLLAATNRDLLQSVKAREFRSDLYYRLNVFPIYIPPLRERREDIRPLVEHFVRKFAGRMKKSITSIPSRTMEALVRWEWPGNIRELENFLERSVILTRARFCSRRSPNCKWPLPGTRVARTLVNAIRNANAFFALSGIATAGSEDPTAQARGWA